MLAQSVSALDEKVLDRFSREAIIHKGIAPVSEQFRQVPRYVVEFLTSELVELENPAQGIAKINQLLEEYFIDSNEKDLIRSRIRQRGQYKLFGQVRVRFDPATDVYWADVPALGERCVRIDGALLARFEECLLTSGMWGTVTVQYDPRCVIKRRMYPFCIIDFVPHQITRIDLDSWVEARNYFDAEEWIDLIITTIGFDPEKLDMRSKALHLARLVPLIEPNINMIELGPCESGKTYTYQSMSNHSHVISGSKTTVAAFFFNKLRRQIGIVGRFDCVVFDEICHAEMQREMCDVIGMLKDYLGSSRFARDNETMSSECSVVLSGNIDTDRQSRSVRGNFRHLFQPLPQLIRDDRAFLDRVHGYVPGWEAPQISPANYANSWGWMADYFSEIMHRMRSRNHVHIVREHADFNGMSSRSQTAITRIASGLLKLVFPHRTAETIEPDELKWAVDCATSLRQRVLDQLAVIAPGEFTTAKLTYTLRF